MNSAGGGVNNDPRSSKLVAALIALAILPYLQTLGHDFVNYDDNFYVTENPHVQRGLTLPGIVWAFTTFKGGNWHPVTWLSHMADVTVWGVKPGGMHFTNMLLHAANTLLVFWIFLQIPTQGVTASQPSTSSSTPSPAVVPWLWRSALVAALFAVHPLHVESVAWIAERKDVLSSFFGLLAIWAYLGYTRMPSARQYLLIICLFVLSLMSKPMLVTLPFMLLLLDVWPLGRIGWTASAPSARDGARPSIAHLILEKIPLLIISAIFSVIAIVSQQAARNISSSETFPLSSRFANAIVGYDLYLEKLIAPVKLAVFYPHPGQWKPGVVLISALLLVIVTVFAIAQRRRRPWLLIGWLWFIGVLVPVIGLIQVGVQSIADRYTYISSIGIFIMVAWSIPDGLPLLTKRAVTAAACIWIGVLAMMTWIQVSHWQDSRALFTHALAVTQNNFIAHQNLGNVLESEKNLDGALEQYRRSANERPTYGKIHENIANVLLQQRRYEDALAELKTAIDLDPYSSSAFNSVGSIMIIDQKYDEAVRALQRAVGLDPDNILARINYGMALVKLGRWNEAIAQLGPITRAEPKRIVARTSLALALAGNGDVDQAAAELRGVLQLAPEYGPAREALQKIEAQKAR